MQVQNTQQAKNALKWAWQDRYIHGLQSFCHPSDFSLISMDKIKCLRRPFWQGLNVGLHDSSLTPNTTITLIEQSHNTHCVATCYN